jgi:hypothetical protein
MLNNSLISLQAVMNTLAHTTRLGIRCTGFRSSIRIVDTQTTAARTGSSNQRLLSTTRNLRAQYERFGFENARPLGPSGPSGGGGKRPGGSQHPLLLALRRRFGDRGIVLYGVGLAGCGVYYVAHLERVPETGRLRFIDTSPESERAMGIQAQQEILQQYQHALLLPSHPTTKRVREVARRIVESNMLGHMKEDHSMNISNINLGSIFGGNQSDEGLFGSGSGEQERLNSAGNKNVEWEVSQVQHGSCQGLH